MKIKEIGLFFGSVAVAVFGSINANNDTGMIPIKFNTLTSLEQKEKKEQQKKVEPKVVKVEEKKVEPKVVEKKVEQPVVEEKVQPTVEKKVEPKVVEKKVEQPVVEKKVQPIVEKKIEPKVVEKKKVEQKKETDITKSDSLSETTGMQLEQPIDFSLEKKE